MTKKKPAKKVKTINGISVILLRGALGEWYRRDWSEEHLKEWDDYHKEEK
tara:strand:+ start:1143 stop:1292 length:150 start_codon:yes stop_codon:yes gene_type:complete